jgi:hypothetical protein
VATDLFSSAFVTVEEEATAAEFAFVLAVAEVRARLAGGASAAASSSSSYARGKHLVARYSG